MIFKIPNPFISKNARIYSRILLNKFIINNSTVKKNIDNKSLYVELSTNKDDDLPWIDITKLCGVVNNIHAEGKYLCVDIDYVDNYPGTLAKLLSTATDTLQLILVGKGIVDDTNSVINYDLYKFILTRKL